MPPRHAIGTLNGSRADYGSGGGSVVSGLREVGVVMARG